MTKYRFGGLLIGSGLPLPEWEAFRDEDEVTDPDVSILAAGQAVAQAWPTAPTIRPDEYVFHARDAGLYRVSQGRLIEVSPFPNAGEREVRLFLLGSAMAAVFYQRHLLLLHASVVLLGSSAVALCGPSGAGKSTLAAALVQRGGVFVCDDLGRVEVAGGRAWAHPSTPRLKLRDDALASLSWSGADLERDHYRANKFQVPQAHHDARSAIELRAFYSLEWNETHPEAVRLTGTSALQALVGAATYRADLLDPMGMLGVYWQLCANVAAVTPVYRLRRPRAWDHMSSVINLVTSGGS